MKYNTIFTDFQLFNTEKIAKTLKFELNERHK